MPLKRIVVGNKARIKEEFEEVETSNPEKNFDSLRSELFVISDKHKMFDLTWHQVVAVMVFTCSIIVLVLLKV
jgi:hypothetical protein